MVKGEEVGRKEIKQLKHVGRKKGHGRGGREERVRGGARKREVKGRGRYM